MEPATIIVMGASAGGVEALSQTIAGLDVDIPAAIFVVLHIPAHGTSVLPAILDRVGPLPAVHATDGAAIEAGTIYVAPPDHHLLLQRDRMCLRRGAHENGSRPAADPLFRSAAHSFGRRVVGVVLSGALDDGTFGLMSVRRHGGTTVVQDPADALHRGMPLSALAFMKVDCVLPAREIGPALNELARRPVAEDAVPSDPGTGNDEEVDRSVRSAPIGEGTPAGISCPHCNGSLWQQEEDGCVMYRCRTGHGYAPESLFAAQSDALEAALWNAVRTLEETSATARRLAERLSGPSTSGRAERHMQRAVQAEEHADLIRRMLRTQLPALLNEQAP